VSSSAVVRRGARAYPEVVTEPPDPHALLSLAVALAEEAGAVIATRLSGGRVRVDTKSSVVDLVTDVDRAVEALIVERLRAERPADGVVGEEGAERDGESGVRWLIDPIDGTTNFVYGVPAFAVSICAVAGDEPAAGVVLDVPRGERFAAARGGGATRNGERIGVTSKAELPTALLGTGFGYDAAHRARQARALQRVLPAVRDIRRGGSAALDLCWVACGRLDAYYEDGVQPWDTAAGELIVREAGGRVARMDGARPGSVVVASGPALLDPLTRLLAEALHA